MKYFLFVFLMISIASCKKQKQPEPVSLSIINLADSYYEEYLKTFPEASYFSGDSIVNHIDITSNKLSEVKKWEEFEDSLYAQLLQIPVESISLQSEKITYWVLKESLEQSIEIRVCKRQLWNVTHMGGWQTNWLYFSELQPVNSTELRAQAIERWEKLPIYVSTEMANLKKGLAEGYSMPREIVVLVMDQFQAIISYPLEESPFMSPAKRANNQEFYTQWEALVSEKIIPAFTEYHNFLKNDYLPTARDEVSLLTLPSGDKCYQAYIREQTTTNKTGNDIFSLGLKIVAANKSKVIEIGKELYQTDQFSEIIKKQNEDSSNYFKASEEILETSTLQLENAKSECDNWFSSFPSSEVTIKPYEAHESGEGSYEMATENKPAFFRINLNNPQEQQKGKNEVLSYHEAYPGHHLQVGIERDLKNLHPISKLITFTSYIEGWARYSEQLAEEMGLYQNTSALINRRAWPARGMVIDPGVHLKGWSKKQTLDFIKESGFNEDMANSLYQRIIALPAQLTSYDVGGEEIKVLRRLAEKELGTDFDIKSFHEKILENGAIPLSGLRTVIEEWITFEKQ